MFTCIATKPLNDGTNGFRFNFLGMKGMTRKRKPFRATSSRGYNIQRGECFNIYNLGRRTIYIEKAANKIITRRVRHFAGQMYVMKGNGKYTVYGDDGKVVIISSDRGLCIAYAKQLKGVITNG